jgi:hypothetical protein
MKRVSRQLPPGWRTFDTISCSIRQHFSNRLKAGGGEEWPQVEAPAERDP